MTTISLPKSKDQIAHSFMAIHSEKLPLDEKLTAIYLRTLQPDVFCEFRPISSPHEPKGWIEAYQHYLNVSEEKKSIAWQTLRSEYAGYIKACEDAKAANDSNQFFLREMLTHFEKMNMPSQKEIVKQRLFEFEEAETVKF